MKHELITTDAWHSLRAATPARIALGRAGGSLPTHEWLAFKSAHSAARDAVHQPFEADQLAAELAGLGAESVIVASAAADRQTFLQRPDLGRQLDEPSQRLLQELARRNTAPDLAIIISDGLSALAVHRQVPSLLASLLPRLTGDMKGAWGRGSAEPPAYSRTGGSLTLDPSHPRWKLAPIVIARFGRVALQDVVGEILGAKLALMLIGERPGLGSPDSLGAYLVFEPRSGNTDANRNCVSNIRPAGLPWDAAADTIGYLLTEARRQRRSGVQLKDERLSRPAQHLTLPDKT